MDTTTGRNDDVTASENTTPRPFPPDGTCTACGAEVRYRQSCYEYRNVYVRDDGAVAIIYTNEHSDGLDDDTIECPACLAEYDMPDEFVWD